MNNNHAFFLLMVTKISRHRPITVAKIMNNRRMVASHHPKMVKAKIIMTIPNQRTTIIMVTRNINKIRLKSRTIITIMTTTDPTTITTTATTIIIMESQDSKSPKVHSRNLKIKNNSKNRKNSVLHRSLKTLDREIKDNVPRKTLKIPDRENNRHHLQLHKADQVLKWSTSIFA